MSKEQIIKIMFTTNQKEFPIIVRNKTFLQQMCGDIVYFNKRPCELFYK